MKYLILMTTLLLLVIGCEDTSVENTKITSDLTVLPHSELAKKFKTVKDERLKGISDGPTGYQEVSRTIGVIRGGLRPTLSNNFKDCGFGVCVCTGDSDCNDLFSNECRDYSSGGSCAGSGESTICVCYPSHNK